MSKGSSLFLVGLLVGVTVTSGVFAWLAPRLGNEGRDGSVRVLQLAHGLPTTHPVHRGMEFMAERAKELSGGKLELQIFHGEQLGSETQCLEAAQAGTLAITKASAGTIGGFVPVFKVFSLPYLFDDSEHFWDVLGGPIGEELLEKISETGDGRPSGLRGLCFYDAGSRSFYTHGPVLTPEDLRGKKIRVMPDPVAVEMLQAFGAGATPIAWGELYSALQQGVVDGAENNPPSYYTSRHYEICRHFTLNHHTWIPDVLVMSSAIWDSLSPEEQGWLQQAADESSVFQHQLWEEENAKMLESLREDGVEIHEVDIEPFRSAAQPVIERYSSGPIGEVVSRIEEARDPSEGDEE